MYTYAKASWSINNNKKKEVTFLWLGAKGKLTECFVRAYGIISGVYSTEVYDTTQLHVFVHVLQPVGKQVVLYINTWLASLDCAIHLECSIMHVGLCLHINDQNIKLQEI